MLTSWYITDLVFLMTVMPSWYPNVVSCPMSLLHCDVMTMLMVLTMLRFSYLKIVATSLVLILMK